ncbi:N-acetyllactosaminide beta-1,3-N-acetylglucosaminyltransferase 2-like [Cheilinus undulatus]|uniref:N-acetyllactosaminide beta-1,3-N-acetylglucosaminyltransferase 2-like n=1 Tax=Cheilinus undulatus TaxID=241271 RepID=UPI001BD38B3F|nr:N-acetyllactosaminide beta-1,3-N-acetylglucosaminyltransferase 2-like [Cheilinus undulatus]
MARCYCRLRKVLICMCGPCIFLALLFIYMIFMVCMAMNSSATPGTMVQAQGRESSHFVALGAYSNKGFAPYPFTFWDLHSHKDAIWNQLQLAVDRNVNPILHPNIFELELKNSKFHESLLIQSFSEVTNWDSTQEKFKKLPQQMQDFMSHMQIRDYPTLNQPDGVCGAGAKDEKEPPLLLLAIKTTEVNFKNRQAIRQTWGQVGWRAGTKGNNSKRESGGYVRRVFLLGKEDPEDLGVDLSNLLQSESKQYGDILQWDFKDTFFNLTLKDVLFWSWFSRFCDQTLFVFKGDDDVFVNTFNMITFLQDQLNMPQANRTLKDFMVGDVIGEAIPSRVNKSKYFISDTFYKGLYPVYAGGGGVVYTGLLAKRLYNISKRVHLFPIDDVYVGMCMFRLNTQPIHNPAFLTFDFPAKEEEEMCAYHKILLVHKRSPNQVVRLWANMKKTQLLCKNVPLRDENKKKNRPKLIASS